MKAFDVNYKLLDEIYKYEYFPNFLVYNVKSEIKKVIDLLDRG